MLRHAGGDVPDRRRVLELNPEHALVERLGALHAADPRSARLEDFAFLIFGQAQLAEGTPLDDPARFGRLVADLMVDSE